MEFRVIPAVVIIECCPPPRSAGRGRGTVSQVRSGLYESLRYTLYLRVVAITLYVPSRMRECIATSAIATL